MIYTKREDEEIQIGNGAIDYPTTTHLRNTNSNRLTGK